MSNAATLFPTLVNTLDFKRDGNLVRNIVLAVAGSALLAVSSKVQIPFPAVPLTLTTLVLLCMSMAFGMRLAIATVLLYLAEGAMGLPVFAGTPAKGIGLVYMLGTTGGYLIGYVLAAGIVGYLAERGWDRRLSTTAAAMLIGNIVIYVPGLMWLGSVVGWDKPVLQWGLTPFIAGDLVKLAIAAVLLPAVWSLIKKR